MLDAGSSGQPKLDSRDFCLLVFGGEDVSTTTGKTLVLPDIFSLCFSKKKNLEVWAKVGAVPLTRACLQDTKVRHEVHTGPDGIIDLTVDPMARRIHNIDTVNSSSCDLLRAAGYSGEHLRKAFNYNNIPLEASITQAGSAEQVAALRHAATHGKQFKVTGGHHCTADDFFLASEENIQNAEVQECEKKKKIALDMMNRKVAVDQIRSHPTFLDGSYRGVLRKDLDILLRWKLSSGDALASALKLKKEEKIQKVKELMQCRDDPQFEPWTDEDEAKLASLKESAVSVKDTALGREQKRRHDELLAAAPSMSPRTKQAIRELLDSE